MNESPCPSCGQPIVWVRTARGKRMPLDAEPTEAGNVVLALGAAIVLSPKRLAPEGRARYMPHHATCPAPVRRRDGVSS